MSGYRIRIRGVVQGVGFRPAVWRVARVLSLKGHVLNDGEGVIVELWCEAEHARAFINAIKQECPPLAAIRSIEIDTVKLSHPPDSFSIVESHETPQINAGIPADAAVCQACIDETLDPGSRRYRYPFTNCTHCGPRLTIISSLPYDRPKTSMASFELCQQCLNEYKNPEDRRFHAQPIACPECGPSVWLCGHTAGETEVLCHPDGKDGCDAIEIAAYFLKQGKIVAVKGVGGFHLVCDATNETAVNCLRTRKRRPDKPFAVMMKDAEQVMTYCKPSQEGLLALQSAPSPVVIMPRGRVTASRAGVKYDSVEYSGIEFPAIAPSVAPKLHELGIMLPPSPLHILLCRYADVPLVMTSANLSGNPQCTDNLAALEDLKDIADYWLMHNRDIVVRADDSVFRQTDSGLQLLRRARGMAPSPISLPKGFESAPKVLALGGEVKNAFCLLSEHGAILSQYIGDLESLNVLEDFERMLEHYQTLYRFVPQCVAVDRHPEYLSTKYGKSTFDPAFIHEVQHHHAHVAACMGDNQLPIDHDNVLGVVFDGLGFGEDGSLWGGEFLIANYRSYTRVGALRPAALPGATQAIVQPWRNLIARLHQASLEHHDFPHLHLDNRAVDTLLAMIETGVNSPQCSSAGRLFDAVSAALCVCIGTQTYEGQAAIKLEALATLSDIGCAESYPFDIVPGDTVTLDPAPMWPMLLNDIQQGVASTVIARKFHQSLAEAISQMVMHLSQTLCVSPKVVLTGGVFQNRLLLDLTTKKLSNCGIEVLIHRHIPANDGGLAFGQALVTAAVSLSGNTQSVLEP
ncbi:carbamoyltransferase HypF [Enterovibrio nigricans]|uniref:Carbamoyltransferase HypF n=1 Tax=Enterovibrio nigricans DSM 22720 TaxID=1121868 RepID=A0A1T4UZS8_9GAMM|nr:carbamoyltransferase HypF [Enterovibrio nigricans]SKA57871.1 hydrogenase maturation protein HypF [Enterovibrio nigricans DSM 22720]